MGTQFDPVAAKAFLKLIAEGKIEIGGLKISAQREMNVGVRERMAG